MSNTLTSQSHLVTTLRPHCVLQVLLLIWEGRLPNGNLAHCAQEEDDVGSGPQEDRSRSASAMGESEGCKKIGGLKR